MSCNKISDSEIIKICEVLKTNVTLQAIDISLTHYVMAI